jgi:predicted 3-demethylubiquinone-9 3-methyltransferase (glyoxalase superfamily)
VEASARKEIAMQRIVPHLWYDTQAKEAAQLYVKALGHGSRIKHASVIRGTPSGDCDIVTMELLGQELMAISAGPYFKFTPAVSFLVACLTGAEVDSRWEALSAGGQVHLELGEYPFSKRYGWLQDRYGLSWQLTLDPDSRPGQQITPSLMFVGGICGKADEAMSFWTTVFRDAGVGDVLRYGQGEEPDKPGTAKFAPFTLEGQRFSAMDNARGHDFTFNEAVSFVVRCGDQAGIDYYWGRLSAVPDAEQCGWLKDRYGVSWQIVPAAMEEMLATGDARAVDRVTQAFLKMKKLDVAELHRAYEGRR